MLKKINFSLKKKMRIMWNTILFLTEIILEETLHFIIRITGDIRFQVTMEEKPTSRYKDSGCSFVVEVQPDYDREETEGTKGSSDDMTAGITDQQALVHREEIPDDRSSGNCPRDARDTSPSPSNHPTFISRFHRFRKYAIIRKHQYRSVAIRSFDIQPRLGQSELPLW